MRSTFVVISCFVFLASAYTPDAQLRCGPNEVEDCVKVCPPERSCRNRGIFFNCAEDPQPCTRKCVCAKGYYRNSIGECVTEEQCDAPLHCGTNEVEDCVKECPPERSCKNRGILFDCAEDPRPCTRKCVCVKGYYRNSIGECITEEQCEQCNKPNQFYSCNSACDNECDKIGYQNRTNCPIVNFKCNEGCYCDDGYARDEEGNCIPVDKCKSPCRDPNEEYIDSRTCPPDECVSLVARFRCDPKEVSQMRCRCRPGYLREKEGSPCVPICQCSEMTNALECKGKQ